jgi:hypothetical protein
VVLVLLVLLPQEISCSIGAAACCCCIVAAHQGGPADAGW